MTSLDHTHDASSRSWIESANDPATEFPLQSLPYCTFSAPDRGVSAPVPGVAIGDRVVDLRALVAARAMTSPSTCVDWTINDLARLPPDARRDLRHALFNLFLEENHSVRDNPGLLAAAVHFQRDVTFHLPCTIRNYTDFYASIDHASTVGAMFRPDQPLLPNYKHVPIGYHGRASSLVPSGSPVVRPRGQQSPAEGTTVPSFGPCRMLDYELEVGCVIAQDNSLGTTVPLAKASERIFGLCLVNDWSARDIQRWEYQPLGPFLAKNFATTVSPFIVPVEALAPFRCEGAPRGEGDPAPLEYLQDPSDGASGGFDLVLEAWLESEAMARAGTGPVRISTGRSFSRMFWTFAQMITHHASNGCNLEAGDLIASGTVSGPTRDSRGCLLELTWDGPGKPRTPITLPGGESRTFLADGDTLVIKGYGEKPGFRRISLGSCRGTIRPSP
ncbi:MAG: fumarylacetoacetase [Phycisphaerae bacterium]|jgi:fumarylacetoacetase